MSYLNLINEKSFINENIEHSVQNWFCYFAIEWKEKITILQCRLTESWIDYINDNLELDSDALLQSITAKHDWRYTHDWKYTSQVKPQWHLKEQIKNDIQVQNAKISERKKLKFS